MKKSMKKFNEYVSFNIDYPNQEAINENVGDSEDTSKYLNPKNLPWNDSVTNNTFGYYEVKSGDGKTDSNVYRFIPDEKLQMKGVGILDMQKKLAFVFRHYNFNSIYQKYYINDPEYRKALTSGIFGGKTMKLVMMFQKIYMKEHFDKYGWNLDTPSNFGMFGGYTKKVLDEKFENARREVQAKMKELENKK